MAVFAGTGAGTDNQRGGGGAARRRGDGGGAGRGPAFAPMSYPRLHELREAQRAYGRVARVMRRLRGSEASWRCSPGRVRARTISAGAEERRDGGATEAEQDGGGPSSMSASPSSSTTDARRIMYRL